MEAESPRAVEVFYSYSHKDEELRDELETHLSLLRRQEVVSNWHDRRIKPGDEWQKAIDDRIRSADIILLLVSPDFLASPYSHDAEVQLAFSRHAAKTAQVIPVILRPCEWTDTLFGELQALPKDGKPVTRWQSRDEAFKNIADGIRRAAEKLIEERQEAPAPAAGGGEDVASRISCPPAVGFVARRDLQGRDILAHLRDDLSPGSHSVVALSGLGGAGKTALAAEFVRTTGSDFKGRVVWLSPLGRADFDLDTLLDESATQLGHLELRRLATGQKTAQVAALLSSQPTLVVLDDFETLTQKEQERCLDFFTHKAACPTLITTRSLVRRDDVRNVQLTPMTMDEARDFLGRLIARTRQPSNFALLDSDDLIRRCEANPLVMQWVVRQIDLAKRPQEVLQDLVRGEGDAVERVFMRSYNLPQLGEDGRAALLVLSLFTPDASRDALAGVAGFGGDPRRLDRALEGLSSLWLVETARDGVRLRLRGLTRTLAKSHLLKDVRADEFARSFVAYFLEYVRRYWRPTPDNLDALEAEKDNLLGAIDLAYTRGDWKSVVLIRGPMEEFLELRGYWSESVRTGKQALAAARSLGDEDWVAVFSHNLAVMYSALGELAEARRLFNESLEIARRIGNLPAVSTTLHELGRLAQAAGDLAEARRLYRESLELTKKAGDRRGIAVSLHQLAVLARAEGKLEEAERFYSESLSISEQDGDQRGVAVTLHELGRLAQASGERDEALRRYEESLEIKRRLGDQGGVATTLHQLAVLAQAEGDLEKARRFYSESIDIRRRLGDQRGVAAALHNLALIYESQGEESAAQRLFRDSLKAEAEEREARLGLTDEVGLEFDVRIDLESRHQRALELMYSGLWREAKEILEVDKEKYKELMDREGFAKTQLALAQIEQNIGDLEKARWMYKDALAQFQDFNEHLAAVTSVYLGRLELQTNFVADALNHLREAEAYFAKEKNEANLVKIRELLAVAEDLAGRRADLKKRTKEPANKTRPKRS